MQFIYNEVTAARWFWFPESAWNRLSTAMTQMAALPATWGLGWDWKLHFSLSAFQLFFIHSAWEQSDQIVPKMQ